VRGRRPARAAKNGAGGDLPQVGDGYWVQNWDITTPAMRCRAVKIDGKTITNR
jgi:hypothetical protein